MPWLTLLLACSASESDTAILPVCPEDSLDAGEVRTFATGLEHEGTTGTEGLVFSPSGRLFVGGAAYLGGGFVAEVELDGSFEVLAPMVGSVGLAWWHDRVVVAVGEGGIDDDEGGIVLVEPDSGESEVLAAGIPGANFPVVTPWDTLLVSAPSGSTIWEVTAEGAGSPWAEGMVSPNGMVFDAAGTSLYVAQTYDDPNLFRRIQVLEDRSAGEVQELALFDTGATQDGVAIDANGDLYVVLNLPGQVVRITPDGETTVVAVGVDFGASMAFGTGEFDPCSLYVTSLFTDALFEVGTGVPGG